MRSVMINLVCHTQLIKAFKKIIMFSMCLVCLTCKKKTTIHVKVFNPALNEYVAGAVISLMEIKDGSLFSKDECNEIATATTDGNGIAQFDKEKLRKKNKYHYKLGIKESWGIAHQNPCGSQTQDYLDVGKTQEVQLSDYMETSLNVQYNNLLNPSISGDSLTVVINTAVYYDPMSGRTQGGGGVFISFPHNGDGSYPYPSPLSYSSVKFNAGKLVVVLHKRKMGVVSDTMYTVKAYPNQSNIIQINW